MAFDRRRGRPIDFELGDRSSSTGRRLFTRLHSITCTHYATDKFEPYTDFVPADRHLRSKKHTQAIESFHATVRHYLARFHRKTHCYSKSSALVRATLNLSFFKRTNNIYYKVAISYLLWFIQFPLDEKGLLIPASRDYFIRRLLAGFHRRGPQARSVLEDNPFVFQPNEERLAIFRSRLGRTLSLPPSRYYPDAQNYLQGHLGYEQWPLVAFQGMADVVARWGEDGNEDRLLNALEHLPHEPFISLCSCLENERISARLERAVVRYALQHLLATSRLPNLLAAGIRGISLGRNGEVKKALIKQILEISMEGDKGIEILAAISGRAWEVLRDPSLRQQFLLRLAEQNQSCFDAVIADIVFLPTLRQPMLHTSTRGKRV